MSESCLQPQHLAPGPAHNGPHHLSVYQIKVRSTAREQGTKGAWGLQGCSGDRIGLLWGTEALPGRALWAPLRILSQPRRVVQRSAASEDTQRCREVRAGARAEAGLPSSLLSLHPSCLPQPPEPTHSPYGASRGVDACMLYRWSSEKSRWSSLGCLPPLSKGALLRFWAPGQEGTVAGRRAGHLDGRGASLPPTGPGKSGGC